MDSVDLELVPIICKYLKADECLNLLLINKRFGYNDWLIKEIKKLFTKVIVDEYSKTYWYLNNKFHRENDKPAIIWSDGSKHWYINGKRHRENDKPAIIWSDESKEWWKNGICHRENGPAKVNDIYGFKAWYLNDVCLNEYGIFDEI